MNNAATYYDYIVVGAGTAGCVVASRLTEDPDTCVLLLEAGKPDDDPDIEIPSRFRRTWETDLDWQYETCPQTSLAERRIRIPRGRVLGGSSSINGMVYVRGRRGDFDDWARDGNEGWSHDEVRQHYRSLENCYDSDGQRRGDGPLGISQTIPEQCTRTEIAFIDAALELGFKGPVAGFSATENENVAGFHEFTVATDGTRASSTKAFLRPALRRRNLAVRTGSLALRVRIDNHRAVGIEFLQSGIVWRAAASREILLCAGAIETPKLLQLSGIGNGDHLQSIGIDVVADLPGVGQNLQDHLLIGASFGQNCAEPTLGSLGRVGAFCHTPLNGTAMPPDLQIQFFPDLRLGDTTGVPGAERRGFTIAPTIVRPKSRGSVMIRSRDPFQKPLIDPGFLSDTADLKALLYGIELAREFARTPALGSLRSAEIAPGELKSIESEIIAYIRNRAETTFHPAGTCSMGHSGTSVVDNRLRVHGIDGLRVIDASIMPTVVSTNTNSAVFVIAENGVRMITGGTRGSG